MTRPLYPTRQKRREQLEAIVLEAGVVLDGLDPQMTERLLHAAGREFVRRELRKAGLDDVDVI
jgi:hypothetical protein